MSPSSCQDIPGDDQGASDEGVKKEDRILQLPYRGRSEIQSCQLARPRLLSQPHVHVSCHRHRVRCRFLQYCSSVSHVRMIGRCLYVSRDPYARDAQPPFRGPKRSLYGLIPTMIVASSAFLAGFLAGAAALFLCSAPVVDRSYTGVMIVLLCLQTSVFSHLSHHQVRYCKV
jgi:hypothetical protein